MRIFVESIPQKRQRRIKQDPQFIFDNSVAESTAPIRTTDEQTTSPILYEPGEIVWSKLGSFPWWPALIVTKIIFSKSEFRSFLIQTVSMGCRWTHLYQNIE